MTTKWYKGGTALVILFLYAIGVIGGAGNLFYYHEYVAAIGVLVTGLLAFPKVKQLWEKFFE